MGYAGQVLVVVPDYRTIAVANCRWRGLDRSPGDQQLEVVNFVQRQLAPFIVPELAERIRQVSR